MLKFRAFFIFAIIAISMNSVTYAADYPAPISDVNFTDIYVDEEMNFYDWGSTVTLNEGLVERVYTVVEGDNLYRIALAHNISLDSLMSINHLTDYLIYPGQELNVSAEEANVITVEKDESEKQEKNVVTANNPSPPPIVEPKVEVEPPDSTEESKEMVMTATAYTAYCTGCSGTTAYGIDLRANPNQKVIAVDPRVIPLGTKVWVEGYGEAIAGDTGGAIKGNKIDVFIPSYDNAMAWGVKTVKLKVLN
ncbi:peptidoglycan-binding protein [Solibacillus sp. R5-41]|uniref:3D domain-containing protein n=1 Tax=Solibacillus sp. R5-41 TaxID=2048654 RepID=UPI000C128516|nr:3D domain-containing protein [Solibacillus sp. R5-41]ATP39178.1 peptidoglycan-binding protein [Solibacillus sp. R5-41]